ncbi:ribose 5-phosphate isomerase B [Mycoplasmoides pneumoniae]|uniref:Probable ribose-5-phosphate isomerase B n=4 Tax=Mycoplasmoides pneumoniae TaxID=2104 RepID=RPIB_MYCPN|nr:ribose 5-phosphate isomerase B [Mycoplasmoides pneumoniae]P53527.1 RecName: Full=Probable ribose-5-phosphate isomerase B; AltName: Full=Phosphoriboisomerase B [Mycoplasmoides pneumoniae M129]AAB95895.1 galactose-6-phosphate isomerase/ribose 5-phosphate isomerase B [Mycoplasmoides pneumoniae M129]AAC43662.1 galactose-6-phosphate isomerase lacA subunit [Mycoplasmoides pneumoniae]ARI11925.1 ribose 5-phosphate isomerase B [Mycoplasmoides pneumoniae]ARI12635.1 ribose 5-phosphate isomerase B [Myc
MQMNHPIYIASDHTGLELKSLVIKHLEQQKLQVIDLGPTELDPLDDYPDYAFLLAQTMQANPNSLGILICGTGVGVCMAANKAKGILAALVVDSKTAALARQHDDANVLCLSSRFVVPEENIKIVDEFLQAQFEGGRHSKRVGKIIAYEREK